MNLENIRALLSSVIQDVDAFARSGLRIILILVIAWLAIIVTQRLIKGFRMRLTARMSDREAIQRAETLGRALRYAASVVISALAVMLMLSELGISVAPLLGAAGVAGVAIGFGAQSLVKDYFAGLSILLEDQVRQGDVVKLGEHSGVVEEVTLRYVRLRDYDGNVHFVPNGTIDSVVSMGATSRSPWWTLACRMTPTWTWPSRPWKKWALSWPPSIRTRT
jgi:small conductance mechanosensitive channel